MAAQQQRQTEHATPSRDATSDRLRDDLTLHLEALEPVLEFGVLHPMIDHLGWFARVQHARSGAVAQSRGAVERLADFFVANMVPSQGTVVADALRAAQAVAISSTVSARPLEAPERWPHTGAFTRALLAGSTRDALQILERHLDGSGDLAEFETHVIQPALYDVGQMWEENEATVADEHIATAIARRIMTVGALRACRTPEGTARILLACAEDNRHEIGLLMVADAFQLAGWQVLFLGADVPVGETVECALDWRADVVGLSVAFAHQMRSVDDVKGRLGALRCNRRIPLIVGGIAATRYPWLAEAKGADAVARTSREAIAIAARLLGRRAPQAPSAGTAQIDV